MNGVCLGGLRETRRRVFLELHQTPGDGLCCDVMGLPLLGLLAVSFLIRLKGQILFVAPGSHHCFNYSSSLLLEGIRRAARGTVQERRTPWLNYSITLFGLSARPVGLFGVGVKM